MGQITIHLDIEAETKALNYIKTLNISLEKWIADLIVEKTSPAWPESVIKLAGSWSDFPTLEELRKETGKDAQRESL